MLENAPPTGAAPVVCCCISIYIIQHVAARFLPLQYSKALTPVVLVLY